METTFNLKRTALRIILFIAMIVVCFSLNTLSRGSDALLNDKISPLLRMNELSLSNSAGTDGITARNTVSNILVRQEGNDVQVYIYLSAYGPTEASILSSYGVDSEIFNEDHFILQAWLPISRLQDVAALSFVAKVTPPSYSTVRAGSVTTEGLAIHRVDELQALGLDGSGIRVGAISNGVDSRAVSQATGDLPEVEIVTFPGSGDEGTAILEIVHDLAPGAALGFCGPETSLEFIKCVEDLDAVWGADIIVDDLGYFGEPYFEHGPVAQAVQAVAQDGVFYTTAAGNEALRHYQGMYQDSGDGMGSHEIGPTNTVFEVLGDSSGAVFVQWANPFSSSTDDYDLCFAGDSPEICALYNTQQDGTNSPIEIVPFALSASGNCLAACAMQVRKISGSPQVIELFVSNGLLNPDDQVAENSIFGHPAVAEALAVGAVDSMDPGLDTVQDFSQVGPAELFFPDSSVQLKPDVVAVDNVMVTGAGGFTSPFIGTSASAPHVAGVAAVLMEGFTTADEIRTALKDTAIDIEDEGPDNLSGAGFVDAFAAAESLGPLPEPPAPEDEETEPEGEEEGNGGCSLVRVRRSP